MSDVYICDSSYHVFVTLIKAMLGEKKVKLVLCTNDVLPDYVIDNIKMLNLFTDVMILSDLEQIDSKLDYSESYFKRGRSLKKQLDSYVDYEFTTSDEYYIFNDNSIMGKCLNAHKIKYNLIEDGLNVFRLNTIKSNNYQESRVRRSIRKFFNAGFYCYGESKYSKTIEVNSDKDLLIKIPKRKLIVEPRASLFASLSKEQKEIIINVYLTKEELVGIRKSLDEVSDGKVSLLITQPLADDKITSKMMHEKFYSDIVEQYSEGKLLIKPHPRDNYDYTKIFPDAVIIKQNYLPIEALAFLGNYNFYKAITWCSTSIEAISFCENTEYLGIEYIRPYILEDRENGFDSQWSYAKSM